MTPATVHTPPEAWNGALDATARFAAVVEIIWPAPLTVLLGFATKPEVATFGTTVEVVLAGCGTGAWPHSPSSSPVPRPILAPIDVPRRMLFPSPRSIALSVKNAVANASPFA